MSRVISGVPLSSCQRWDAPNVGSEPAGAQTSTKLPTEQEIQQELEQLRLCAYEEGFAKGHAEGLARARQEVDTQLQRLEDLIVALARPFQDLDSEVEAELVALVTTLVRQLVRREIRSDPGIVVAAAREALAVLPVGSRNVILQLHPADAALVRELMAAREQEQQEQDFRIAENPALTRGGCFVVSESSRVDATVERRLSEAILKVFGGERRSDPPPEIKPEAAGAVSGQDLWGRERQLADGP